MPPPISLTIDLGTALPRSFLRLFQKGVGLEVELGGDLLGLLTEELCLSDSGIAKIQTIFWQGHPVDELSECIVENGGVLALSAALPGLVGACLRRGGAWSALRDSISYRGEIDAGDRKHGQITLKLFNFMMEEVGPMLLERGVLITGARAAEAIRDSGLDPARVHCRLNGSQVAEISQLLQDLADDQLIQFRVGRPEAGVENPSAQSGR